MKKPLKPEKGALLAGETLLKPFSFDGWGYEKPRLDLAERQAQMEEYRAELAEKGPFPDVAQANEHREMAAWWRTLKDCLTRRCLRPGEL
jgi:hypothetical protein